tara:strand:- start:178585 stop:179583 length:999 start_codon:yes stop_codon:yes gene_type:complete
MSFKVGINGFGRIGRMIFRSIAERSELEVVAINDLTDGKTLGHLLKYDSVHGPFDGSIESGENDIYVDGKKIKIFSEKIPKKLPWQKLGVDVVVESTGFFVDGDKAAEHLSAGAKKVLITAPAKNVDATIVLGVNDHLLKSSHRIISNASCTTNCLAPMASVLHKNFNVLRGCMTTIHAYTSDQQIIDYPHSDLRRSRSGAVSMIPTITGAAKAIGEVIPGLEGRLNGMAVRVPVPNVSMVDFVAQVEQTPTVDEVNQVFSKVAEGKLKGIIEYCDDPIVSVDLVHNAASCIFDSQITMIVDDGLVKICGWYDNEWGYSNRCVDLIERFSEI